MYAPVVTKFSQLLVVLLCLCGTLCSQTTPIAFTDRTNLLLTDNFSGFCMGIADMNADGKDDIVRYNLGRVLNIEVQRAANQTFRHIGGNPISNFPEWSTCIADVDRDGYNDILVGGSYDNIKILRSQQGESFNSTNLPNSSIFLQGSNFIDLNNDGWLDVFACHDDGDNREYLNDGSGSFSYEPRFLNTTTFPSSDNSGNYASIWTDYDNDGDQDLYISKCRAGVSSSADPRRLNAFYENDGQNNFTEIAASIGLKIGAQTWLTDFADIDNDGDMDAFVLNHYDDCQLLLNDGRGNYTDITATSGFLPTLGADSGVLGFQGIFRDFNNDGYVDLLFAGSKHFLFYNNGDRTFSAASPFNAEQIQSFAIGDLNHDGFLDVYTGYSEFSVPSSTPDALFINQGNNNNFIAVTLEGIESNINGIGARVSVYDNSGMQIREVRSGEGYGIMNTLTQHFGIGNSTSVSRIVIDWPSGISQTITNPAINQFHYIKEQLSCAGQACNDGDPCTTNDITDDYCNCTGTLVDSDNDGVCDSQDLCPGYNDNVDTDNDGIPNGCDNCPSLNNNLIGRPCDDNNPCTTGETYDNNCNCSGGTVLDSDNDGVCDAQDRCPGYNDFADTDNDGTPDGCDSCPNLNDNIIGTSCNDGNPCTVGETYDSDCGCSGGQYVDNDNDGYCIGEDTNDNDPCIPNNTAGPCGYVGQTTLDCTQLDYTSFEDGYMGIWQDGGSQANILLDSQFASSGSYTFYIQGNGGTNSSISTTSQDLSTYDALQLKFVLFPFSMETGDKFHIEIATSGNSYTIYKTFNTNTDFQNQQFYSVTTDITGISLSATTKIRFRTETNELGDYIMLDELTLLGCKNTNTGSGPTGPNCPVGAPCDDGDICTSGETYDSNCNCTGGTYLDNDNDGICNAQDSCPNLNNNLIGQPCNDNNPCTTGETYDANCGCSGGTTSDNDGDGFCSSVDPDDNDPCIPNSNYAGCNNGSSDYDCSFHSYTDFEDGLMGPWVDGGSSARIIAGPVYANSGSSSFYIQSNNGSRSSLILQAQEWSEIDAIRLSFSVLPYSVETGDKFLLEIATNGTYVTYKTYLTGLELTNSSRMFEDLIIDDISFSNSTSLRLRSIANSNSDYFIFDDISIETCGGSSPTTNCPVGQPCSDGDRCTIGEYFDNNCNCIGGTYADSDNDGVCDAEDICPTLDDNLIGQPCNDGNACTIGERYDDNCNCSGGNYIDADNDGYCIGEDQNDNDPCVPNANASACNQTIAENCSIIDSTSFENNHLGIWNDGGANARIIGSVNYAGTGSFAMYIQGNNGGSSSIYTNDIDLSPYTAVNINFHVYAFSVESGDKFFLEYKNSNGNYITLRTFETGVHITNGDRLRQSISITNLNFNANSAFRFRAATSDLGDYFIIDDLVIEACNDQPVTGCQVGTACDDNNDCSVGETYDSNCNCTGGVVIDNDGDGFCAVFDTDDNDPCIPNTNGPGCNTDLDCSLVSVVDFEGNQLGIWNDGGSDARILNSSNFAFSGNYTFYIHGEGGPESSLYSDPLNFQDFNALKMSFNLFAYSVEAGDRFFIEISNGGPYATYKTYTFGTDFVDNTRKNISLDITGINLTSTTSIRFRMRGVSDSNYVMFDDIYLEACTDNQTIEEDNIETRNNGNRLVQGFDDTTIYPNPATDHVTVETAINDAERKRIDIFDLTGRLISSQILTDEITKIDLEYLSDAQLLLFRITNEYSAEVHSQIIFKN